MPGMLGQIGHIATATADAMMVGQLGAIPLAGISYAMSVMSVPMVFGIGVAFGLTPLVANAYGAKDESKAFKYLKHATAVNVVTAVVMFLALIVIHAVASRTGQEPEVLAEAEKYIWIRALSYFPFMLFMAGKQYVEGRGDTKLPMRISLWCNAFNVAANFVLIFGVSGMVPAMGIKGAAMATLLARIGMAIWVWSVMAKQGLISRSGWATTIWERSKMKEILDLGIPSGLQYIFEVSAFAVSAIIIGTYGAEPLAAHQIAISLAAISYMAATGFGGAATIRVGQLLGEKRTRDAQEAGTSIFLLTSVFMVITGAIFFFGRDLLPFLYTDIADIAQLASMLLIVAVFFQLSDGVQAAALGALRGAKDVRVPTALTFIAYYIVALPLEYLFGTIWGYEAVGVWWALAVGLTVSAVLLVFRFYRQMAKA